MTRYRCSTPGGIIDGMIFERYQDASERATLLNKRDGRQTVGGLSDWRVEDIPDEEPRDRKESIDNDSEERLKEMSSKIEELSQRRVSVTSVPDNSGAEFAGLVAVLFGIVGGLLSWLFSTQIGRKVLAVLAIFLGIVYAKNAWENRAYVDTIYYENGNIKAEQSYKFKKLNGVSKFYSENGKLEKEQNYKNNELEGPSTEYYANGKAKSEQNYTAGKLNGVSIFYLETGIKEKEQTYKDDIKNGPSKIYYPNGAIKSEAMISNNTLNGVSILYDENGNILRKENFVNGKSTNIIE